MAFLKQTYHYLFFIGVFFIPFNSEIPAFFGFLGEYSRESTPIFLLLSFLVFVLYSIIKGSLFFPIKSQVYNIFALFLILSCLATLFNLHNILDYYYKQTSGVNRFIRQMVSLVLISVMFFVVFINVCKDYGVFRFFLLLRKIFFISFLIVFSCGIIEYFIVAFNVESLVSVIEWFNYLPFVEIKLEYRLIRVSSLTYEPPALGTYLLTISGFMFSYMFTSNKPSRIIPFLMVVLLALMTKSRTAFVIIFVQIAFGTYYAYNKHPKFRSLLTKSVVVGFVLASIALIYNGKQIVSTISERIEALDFANNTDFKKNENAVSNKSRLGIQYANFQVFKKNPIFGTGWGQQTYEALDYYPDWALKDNYEFRTKYLNEDIKSFPPGYNMYIRILAETGIVGMLVFLLFLYVIVHKTLFFYKHKKEYNFISIALIISFSGYFLNWLQIDSFRIYGFWISLAILIMLQKEKNGKDYSVNSTL